MSQTENKNLQTEARVAPVRVPSVTISIKPQLVAPSPSIDTFKSGDEFDGAGGRERMLVKKYYQNSSGGFIGKDRYKIGSISISGQFPFYMQ